MHEQDVPSKRPPANPTRQHKPIGNKAISCLDEVLDTVRHVVKTGPSSLQESGEGPFPLNEMLFLNNHRDPNPFTRNNFLPA